MLAIVNEPDFLVFGAPAEASGLTMTAKVYAADDTLLATLPASEWVVAGTYRTNAAYSWPSEAFYTVVWSGGPGGDIGQSWQAVQPGSAAFVLTGGALTLDGAVSIEAVLAGAVVVDLTLDAVCSPEDNLVAMVRG